MKDFSKTPPTSENLEKLARERILIMDGAMGTMIQQEKLEEGDFRGDHFKNHSTELKGNNDLLCLTRPEIIRNIHSSYFEAGSDHGRNQHLQRHEYRHGRLQLGGNRTRTQSGRGQAGEGGSRRSHGQRSSVPVSWPEPLARRTERHLSHLMSTTPPCAMLTSMNSWMPTLPRPRLLSKGGVDVLLPETTFDTLNLKAAIFAIENYFESLGRRIPVIMSITITDASGRTLSGQTTEACWNSIAHAKPMGVGLNCALGADAMRPYLQALSKNADCFVHCYPNAGLPNPLSATGYDEKPEDTANALSVFAEEGLLNLAGGCCGTTPDHIHAISEKLWQIRTDVKTPEIDPALRLSGLEPFELKGKSNL